MSSDTPSPRAPHHLPDTPLVPLVMKLVGQSLGFSVAQCLVAVLAWGYLAFTVGRLVDPGWRRVAAVWIVLGFATSTPITLWNRSVLSESLSLSLLLPVLLFVIPQRSGGICCCCCCCFCCCLCLSVLLPCRCLFFPT